MLTRREFLTRSLLALPAGAILPAVFRRAVFAAEREGTATTPEAARRTLVIVQMAGGNDGLNTVVPYGDGRYYDLRKVINIPQKDVLPLSKDVGLHPSMGKFKALWDDGKLGVVEGVGYPNPNYSHFVSMRIWQSADPQDKMTEGWVGRYFDGMDAEGHLFPALAVGGSLPRELSSPKVSVPVVESVAAYQFQGDPRAPQLNAERMQALRKLYAAMPQSAPFAVLLHKTQQAADASIQTIQKVDREYKPAVDYPRNGLAGGLKLLAEAINSDLGVKVCHVSIGGWDTHANEKASHVRLLEYLSDSIAAFHKDLVAHGRDKDVLVMTWSEFGRRAAENGSAGTDHGAAAPMFLVGTPVKGGLYGQRPDLGKLDNGNLRYTVDFRSVYASVLDEWLGSPSEVVLGGQKFEKLGFVRQAA